MRTRLAAPLPLLALALAACGSPATLREPDGYNGCATDETWRLFDERELGNQVTVDDAQAPVFQPPTVDGAALPASPPPSFTWRVSAAVAGTSDGSAACGARCGTPGAIGVEHCAPVSGDIFDLQLSVGGALVYRLLTTQQHWEPPAAVWARLRGKSVSLVTVRAELKTNGVQGGPYRASRPLTFTVGS